VALGVISRHLLSFTVGSSSGSSWQLYVTTIYTCLEPLLHYQCNETVNIIAGFYLSTIFCISSQKQLLVGNYCLFIDKLLVTK